MSSIPRRITHGPVAGLTEPEKEARRLYHRALRWKREGRPSLTYERTGKYAMPEQVRKFKDLKRRLRQWKRQADAEGITAEPIGWYQGGWCEWVDPPSVK